jgi:hypothetical protein
MIGSPVADIGTGAALARTAGMFGKRTVANGGTGTGKTEAETGEGRDPAIGAGGVRAHASGGVDGWVEELWPMPK